MYNPNVAVHYEIDSPAAPRSGLGPYREGDYVALPEEPRCELLYGHLVVTASPDARHQDVLVRLVRTLLDRADRSGARLLVAPMDVRLAEHSVVQPDLLLVTAARAAIVRRRVEGAPDLAIEILSPATARRDRGEKLRLYLESGVAEYWIVDPEARTIEHQIAIEGSFVVRLPVDGRYRSAAIEGLELDLEAFWKAIPD